MIIIIGVHSDRTINYFSDYLLNRNVNFIFLNIDELGSSVKINDKSINIGKHTFSYDCIDGVFNRMVASLDSVAENKSYMSSYELLSYLLDFRIPTVINKPSCTGSNHSKPYQLKLINTKHIQIPKTIIYANCPAGFVFSQNEPQNIKIDKYIYKSTSSYRSIVNVVDKLDHNREINCPTLFQEKFNGPNYRVHVVGNKVFPLKIVSDRVDYRYYYQHIERTEEALPDDIANECIEINRQLDLGLSGIDLIKQNDIFYLFEVNTYPGYDCFEEYMQGTPISDAIYEIYRSTV